MDRVFSSWQEIAVYLGKGIRTVQRWEQTLGLPVHRPNGRRMLIAHQEEIDAWIGHCRGQSHNLNPQHRTPKLVHESRTLQDAANAKINNLNVTLGRTLELCSQISDTLTLFSTVSNLNRFEPRPRKICFPATGD